MIGFVRRREFREMMDEIGEHHRLQREALERGMRSGIQASTEGLLRVLDEFRRDDGPAAAGA